MVAATVPVMATATKFCAPGSPPYVNEIQLEEDGSVLAVQVIPSEDVDATVDV